MNVENTGFVPQKDKLFVEPEFYGDIEVIFKSGMFYPVLITGPSGVAKTLSINQLCAKHNRVLYRVNITKESDEDSLMGGFRLEKEDGVTVTRYSDGPVVKAMKEGAVLLLDEIDLADPMRVMCLQSVLEGNGYLIKKTGEMVIPKKGFQIYLSANTKGGGDETGHYIGTQVLNEAMLDRIPETIEATYPSSKVENLILSNLFDHCGLDSSVKENKQHIAMLIQWANEIRQSTSTPGENELSYNISTRRLCHVVKSFSIRKDMRTAIEKVISRFDVHHKTAFLRIYDALGDVREFKLAEDIVNANNEDLKEKDKDYNKWKHLTPFE